MSVKYFLDTNIFVYSFDRNAPEKAKTSTQLIRQAVTSHTGIVSYQVIQEFLHVALRRFSQPMTTADAEQYLSTVLRPLLMVHSSLALYIEALGLQNKFRISWYDSLIVAAAIEGGCNILYSEDLQHGMKFGDLQVKNPFL
jgi:predicted nucleic acid-binding protein